MKNTTVKIELIQKFINARLTNTELKSVIKKAEEILNRRNAQKKV